MKKIFVLLMGTALSLGAVAQNLNTGKLDSLLNTLAENNKRVGSLAISQNGKVIYQKSTGVPGTTVGPQTRYRVGSISKMFTATLIFQLIDEGKLTLGTTLAKFYPQLPNADKITIQMMLTHRSGLFNFTGDLTYKTFYQTPQTSDAMVARFATYKPAFEPDSKAAYSNTNFALLGYIAEKITGKTYAQLINERIIKKIGLKDTYAGGKIGSQKNEIASYAFNNGKWEISDETDMSIPAGAGAIVSTTSDLVKFIEALFSSKLVSESSLTTMKTMNGRMGSGMFSYNFNNIQGYGHNGSIDEFKSELIYFPEQKLGIAYLSNGGTYSTNTIDAGVMSIYFNKPFNIPSFKIVELKSEDLDKFIGNYASTQIPLKIAVTKNGNKLVAQGTGQPPLTLDATSANTFKFDAANVILEFKDNTMTLIQNGNTILFTRE